MRYARRPHPWKRLLASPFMTSRLRNPKILLTFDDGPHPIHTRAVLERLQPYGITARFFLVGNRIAAAPELPRAIVAAGHTLGNHTFAHRRGAFCDMAVSLDDVRRCQSLIPEARWLRPPFGRLTPGVWLAARSCGLTCMTWSLDSGDWQCRCEADARQCAQRVLEAVRPGDIVLFHDDHPWIGPILDLVLPGLAARAAGRGATL